MDLYEVAGATEARVNGMCVCGKPGMGRVSEKLLKEISVTSY